MFPRIAFSYSLRGHRKKGQKTGPKLMCGRDFLAPTPSVRQPLFETSERDLKKRGLGANSWGWFGVQFWLLSTYLSGGASFWPVQCFFTSYKVWAGSSFRNRSLVLSLSTQHEEVGQLATICALESDGRVAVQPLVGTGSLLIDHRHPRRERKASDYLSNLCPPKYDLYDFFRGYFWASYT